VPFILTNIPPLLTVAGKWTDDYLKAQFSGQAHPVEVSNDNHFMWYNKKYSATHEEYTPPLAEEYMSYDAWLAKSRGPAAPGDKHYYFKASHIPPAAADSFISRDYTIFDPAHEDSGVFLVDKAQQRGVHCRFGMPGIIAEAHYDAGRNFVSMVRGHKRYLLAPPSECEKLHILKQGPSIRHSAVDWSDPYHSTHGLGKEGRISNSMDPFWSARVIDVVIGPGEAMYIPSFYFHLPISLDESIQCNSRSGVPQVGGAAIEQCGFQNFYTEGPNRAGRAEYGDDDGIISSVTRFFTGRGPKAPSLFSDPIWIMVAAMAGIVSSMMAYKVGMMIYRARSRRKIHNGL